MENKKIIEQELDIDTVDDNLFGIDIDMSLYSIETEYRDKPFFIVSWDEFKMENPDLDYDVFSSLCDKQFEYQWGTDDAWYTCSNCFKAIYTEDYYSHDFYITDDGDMICGDCVRADPTDYFDTYLANDSSREDTLVNSAEKFENCGYRKVITFEYYNEPHNNIERKNVLDDLLDEYPNGKFIFSNCGIAHGYCVWGKNKNL